MKKTKIIATAGPSTDNIDVLTRILEEGADVIRMNLSHGTIDEWEKRLSLIREAREKTGKNVAVLLDTKGPEIRTGYVEGYEDNPKERIRLDKENEITLICDPNNAEKEGDVIARGRCYNPGKASGNVRVAFTGKEAINTIEEGDILAAYNLTLDYSNAIDKAGALLVSGTNYDKKAIEYAKSKNIPILTDIRSLRKRITDNIQVDIIGEKGVVLLSHPN